MSKPYFENDSSNNRCAGNPGGVLLLGQLLFELLISYQHLHALENPLS